MFLTSCDISDIVVKVQTCCWKIKWSDSSKVHRAVWKHHKTSWVKKEHVNAANVQNSWLENNCCLTQQLFVWQWNMSVEFIFCFNAGVLEKTVTIEKVCVCRTPLGSASVSQGSGVMTQGFCTYISSSLVISSPRSLIWTFTSQSSCSPPCLPLACSSAMPCSILDCVRADCRVQDVS